MFNYQLPVHHQTTDICIDYFQQLCPILLASANIWQRLPSNHATITIKLEYITELHQLQELRKQLLIFWNFSMSLDISHTEGRLAVYHALYALLTCIDNISQIGSLAEDSMRGGPDNILYKHWRMPYIGKSCDMLQNTIRGYEEIFKRDQYFSKSILVVQSSGTGKSRLAHEYGKVCPMVTYVVRNDEYGFPPNNSPTFSASSRACVPWDPYDEGQRERSANVWFHAISVGILQATFETCEYQSFKTEF